VVNVAGEMTELSTTAAKTEKYTIEQKTDWYAQLIGWAMENNKKPGLAFYKYQERFGVQPSMAKPEPKPPSPEVISWIKSRNIAWANSKAKK
jgi:predicted enzyme related to lactoylglutathione lyase